MTKRAELQPIDFPIIGDSKNASQDEPEYTMNMYAEKVSEEVMTLKPTPGTTLQYQFGVSGGGRSQPLSVNGRLFGVRGAFFQEMVNGSPVLRGELNSTDGKVAMISCVPPGTSGLHPQILIVDDTKGYQFDLTTDVYTPITSAMGFVGGGAQAAFCAGRAFVFKPGTNEFQCSDLYDFTTWDGGAFKAANSLSDSLKALAASGELLYVFSRNGFEVWQDNGDNSFIPVSRILAIDKTGITAPNSILVSERYIYWMGGNNAGRGIVYRHNGGGMPERISTHPIERNIAALPSQDKAIGMSYESLGHIFYMLNFLDDDRTFVFDSTTGLWAERGQRDPVSGNSLALPFIGIDVFNNQILGMSYFDGAVDLISNDIFSDRGNPIIRERKTAVIPKEADYMTYFGSVEIFTEQGNNV